MEQYVSFLKFNGTKQPTLFSNKNSYMIIEKGIKCSLEIRPFKPNGKFEFSSNTILKNVTTFGYFKENIT